MCLGPVPVVGRKVSIYNVSVMPKNPLNGMWLTNDTGLSLLGEPLRRLAGHGRQYTNMVPSSRRTSGM